MKLKNAMQIFKKVYNKVKKKYMPPIDPVKVNAKLLDLNGKGTPVWIVAEGLRALTSMSNENGKISFNPNNGVPIKIFVNTKTGEIKIYDARAFT